MDAHYQTMYKQAAALQHQFHDYTHATAHDPMANVLRQEIHHLTNDIAGNKNLRTIDTRLQNIQKHIQNSQRMQPSATGFSSPYLNHNQSNMLHSNFAQMRKNIQSHPKF